MADKLNIQSSDDAEIVTIKLSKHTTPIAYQHKVNELVKETDMSVEDAEKEVEGMEIDMEMFYEEGKGLFLVESDAIPSGVCSPYSQKELTEDE